MKTLFKISCSKKTAYHELKTFRDIYVVAETVQEASEKALSKMKELGYDEVDGYVSSLEVIADGKEQCMSLLIN
jgi:hypothetical protein